MTPLKYEKARHDPSRSQSGAPSAKMPIPNAPISTAAAQTMSPRGACRCISHAPVRLPGTLTATTTAAISEAAVSEAPRVCTRKVGSHTITPLHCSV